MPFLYDSRLAVDLQTDGIFSCHSTSTCLAYITFDTIRELRSNYVYSPPCKKNNLPVLNVRQKRLRSLEPHDQATDPYIVAVLIALAQAQRESIKQCLSEKDATAGASNLMWKWDTSSRPGIAQPRTQPSPSPDTDVENENRSFKVCVVSI